MRQQPDIQVIATRNDREAEVLIWNYHDEDVDAPAAAIDLAVMGIPISTPPAALHIVPTSLALVEHFRIDARHSNAFTAWKEMGSPPSPSPEQYERLQSAGQLQLLTSPAWLPIDAGAVRLQFTLPRQGLSLVRLTW